MFTCLWVVSRLDRKLHHGGRGLAYAIQAHVVERRGRAVE